MMRKLASFVLLCLFTALGACGSKGPSSSGRILTPEELKAQNDASKKAYVDAFMREPRVFDFIADPEPGQVKAVSFKTFPNDTYQLEIQFIDDSNTEMSGTLTRIYDSDQILASLYIADLGTVDVYKQTEEPKAYCPTIKIHKNLPEGMPKFRIQVCESKAAGRQ